MWPIKTCLFFGGFIAACALSLAYPIVGIVNYMMVYQVNPERMWWGRPLAPLDIRYSMTAAVCLILGMVFSAGRVPRSRVIFGSWMMLLFLFTFTILCSGWVGVGSTNYGVMLMDKMVKMAIFLVCLARMGATRTNFKIIIWALVIGTLIIGNDAYHAPRSDFFFGRLNFVGGADFRDSSGLAAHLAAMLPLVGVAMLIARSWPGRITALVSGMLAVNTIVQCRTRSAFVGLLAGAVLAFIMVPHSRRWRVYMALAVGSVGAFALTDNSFWHRMRTVFQSDGYATDAAIQSRVEVWSIAGSMVAEYPFGVGVGRFRDVMAEYNDGQPSYAFIMPRRVAHNSYLLCLSELGIHGFAIFGALIANSLWRLQRCSILARDCDKPEESRLLTYGCLLAVVIYLVAAGFTDRLYTESYWWILALPLCP